ncbi:MAG: hypothetical protein ACYC1D_04840, partial [Acidimicrobiales bacterium]
MIAPIEVGGASPGVLRSLPSAGQVPGTTSAAGVTGSPRAAWLSATEAWHRAERHPVPIVLDAGIAGGTAAAVSGSGGAGLVVAVTTVVAGLLFGLWKRRMSLETQGVGWLVKPAALTLAVAATATALADGRLTAADAGAAAAVAAALILGIRVLLWMVISSARRRGRGLRATLVIAPADRIAQIEHRLSTFPEAGLRFVAGHEPSPRAAETFESGRTRVNSLLDRFDPDQVLCVADAIDETVLRDFVRFGVGRVDCGLVLPLAGLCAGQTRGRIGDLGVIPIRLRPSWGT